MLKETVQRRPILTAFVLFLIFIAIPWSLTDDLKLTVLTAAYQQSWYFLYLVVVFEIAGFLAAVVFTILMLRLLWHAGSWFSRTQPGGRPYIGRYSHGHVPNIPVQPNEGVQPEVGPPPQPQEDDPFAPGTWLHEAAEFMKPTYQDAVPEAEGNESIKELTDPDFDDV